jgi:hypothetical protein
MSWELAEPCFGGEPAFAGSAAMASDAVAMIDRRHPPGPRRQALRRRRRTSKLEAATTNPREGWSRHAIQPGHPVDVTEPG